MNEDRRCLEAILIKMVLYLFCIPTKAQSTPGYNEFRHTPVLYETVAGNLWSVVKFRNGVTFIYLQKTGML